MERNSQPTTKAEALARRHAEEMSDGCVGQLEWSDTSGTVLAVIWVHPGCETHSHSRLPEYRAV